MSNLNNAPWAKYGEVPQAEDGEDSKSTTSSSRSAARDIVRSMNQQRYTDLHTQGFVDEGIVTAPVSVSSSSSTVVDERQAFLRNANLNSDYMYDDDHHGSSNNRSNVDTGIVIGADDPSDGDDNQDGGSNPEQGGPTTQRNRNWLKLGGIFGGILIIIVGVVVALYFTVINKPSPASASKSAPLSPSSAPSSPISEPLVNETNFTFQSSLAPIFETNATSPPSLAPMNETNATITSSLAPTAVTNATLPPSSINATNATFPPTLAPSVNNMTNLTLPPTGLMNETNVTNSSFTQDDWQQQDTNIDTLLPNVPGDLSGFSVSLSGSGSRLAVGSPGTDSDGGTKSGVMTVVEDTGNGTWTKVETLQGTVPGQQLGISVALSKDGNFVVVGSLKEGTDSEGKGGSVRVYEIMASSATERNLQSRQLSDLMDDDFSFTYSVSSLLRRLQKSSSKQNGTFNEALMQAAEAVGIEFDGNVTAYAEALKNVIKNTTESGTYSSIVDGNDTYSFEDVLSLTEILTQPSTVADAGGSILSDSNTSSADPSTTSAGDFASILSAAATSLGISYNGSDLAAYIAQLTDVVQTVASSENVTSITNGNTTISTTDFLDLANSLQNSSAAIDIFPTNETALLPTNETASNGTLKQLGKTLYLETSAKQDYFGHSLSISNDGTQIVMGAPAANGNAGNVYVYKFDEAESDWKRMNLESSPQKDDYLGWSVAMSGDGSTLAAGAPYRTNKKPGYVNLYTMQGDSWAISKTFTPENLADNIETDDFGFSVALDNNGRTLVIGSPNSTLLGGRIMNPPGRKRGKAEPATGYVIVYGFDETLTEWSQMGEVLAGEQPSGQLGYSVAVSESGTRIVAGAPNRNSGYVCVYNFDELTKQWEKAPSIVGTDSGGDTGHSVSISSNGLQLSIGSPSQTQCRQGNEICKQGTVQVFQDPNPSVDASTRITGTMKYY